jgi:flagellar hook assembly protein FlgD
LEIAEVNLRNYPNPFNPSTTISFNLTTEIAESTELTIYNLKGQKIRNFDVILSGVEAELNSITWNGDDSNGKPVSSGIYYYKLVVDDKVIDTKKMLLMK